MHLSCKHNQSFKPDIIEGLCKGSFIFVFKVGFFYVIFLYSLYFRTLFIIFLQYIFLFFHFLVDISLLLKYYSLFIKPHPDHHNSYIFNDLRFLESTLGALLIMHFNSPLDDLHCACEEYQ